MLTAQNVKDLLARHDAYWETLRPRMKEWKRAYMTQFWSDPNLPYGTSANGTTAVPLVTEVARTFALVEGYIGSIYARNPAVVMTPDLRGEGNPEVAQAVANEWLLRQRAQIEDASRLALIFPWAAIRLGTSTSPDPLRRVTCTALPPWEVLVDDTAGSWDQQRWIGVVSLVTVEDAVARFGKRRSSYRPRAYSRWLDSPTGIPMNGQTSAAMDLAQSTDDPGGGWVRIVEVYDLESDRLVVWSPDHDRDDRFLFRGVRVQTGASPEPSPEGEEGEAPAPDQEVEQETTYSGIPFRDAAGNPVVPIVPLYFSRDPEIPLRGYSLVGRVYPLVAELNLMRTYRLRGVRRMARQWLVRPGFLDQEAVAKIGEGVDSEMIECTVQPGEDLNGNMVPVPQEPIPADIAIHEQQVEADIQQSGVNAPFVSGQVTGVTATENRLLQEYTASSLGRMVRVRDQAIVDMALAYVAMLAVILADEGEPLNLPGIGPVILTEQDLRGQFPTFALDQGSTPMGDAAKREALVQLTPILGQLGAPAEAILRELVRAYNLPDTFVAVPEAPAGPPALPEGV